MLLDLYNKRCKMSYEQPRRQLHAPVMSNIW